MGIGFLSVRDRSYVLFLSFKLPNAVDGRCLFIKIKNLLSVL
jgi:hypothetical protein